MTTDNTADEERNALLHLALQTREQCDNAKCMECAEALEECANDLHGALAGELILLDSLAVADAKLAALQPVRPEGGWPAPHEPGWWWVAIRHADGTTSAVAAHVTRRRCGELESRSLWAHGVPVSSTCDGDHFAWGPRVVEWVP